MACVSAVHSTTIFSRIAPAREAASLTCVHAAGGLVHHPSHHAAGGAVAQGPRALGLGLLQRGAVAPLLTTLSCLAGPIHACWSCINGSCNPICLAPICLRPSRLNCKARESELTVLQPYR